MAPSHLSVERRRPKPYSFFYFQAVIPPSLYGDGQLCLYPASGGRTECQFLPHGVYVVPPTIQFFLKVCHIAGVGTVPAAGSVLSPFLF